MMLDNAREKGAEVLEGVRVKEVLFEGTQAVGVRANLSQSGGSAAADGVADLRAKVVVDATGICGLLSRQLNVRQGDPQLKNAAIYAYFKNAKRDPGRNAGATLVIHTPDRNGWFWFIPLPDEITSIGVVAPPSYLCTGRGDNPLATLEEEIAGTPAIAGRLASAERVSGAYVTSDFTYRSKQMAGDGWVMVGDAFCFLDPIYSSGVMLALKSGEWAADAIHDALEAGDYSAARLGRQAPLFVHGVQMIRQLVYAFYDRRFSFAAFLRAHPQYHDHLVRILIGDVFNHEVGAIFDVMGDWTDLPAAMEFDGVGRRAAAR
jgi:flavin-dependent dehydrogenase